MFTHSVKMPSPSAISVIMLAIVCVTASAETTKIAGLIKAREGDSMIVQTSNAPNIVVLLTDSTQVGQVQGLFKARRKDMSMAALIPGLAVKVKGVYNEQKQLVATEV